MPKRLENTSPAIAGVAVLGAVYFGSSVLAPVVSAPFIMALAWPLQCRLQAHLPNKTASRILLDGCAATAAKFRRYMLIRTLMSMATG